jgi:multicomponent K+:H+ antiporter subunit C
VEALVASGIGVMFASGVYLMLRARTFPVVVGLALFTYAINFLIFVTGRLTVGGAPIVRPEAAFYPDPLPQALVLTAIVIAFGMTGFVVVLALRAYIDLGTDHVDGDGRGDEGEGGGRR